MLVLSTQAVGPALPPCTSTGDDLLGEIAGGDGLGGALLRAQRKGVLIGAGDLEFLGDVLGGLGHGVDAVLRLHQRIDEAPAERGVEDFRRARKRFAGFAHHERRARHGFDAAGNGEIHFAGTDRARGVAHGIQPRSAKPVHRDARDLVRQAREQERHARDIAVVLAGLVGAAEEYFVEPRPIGFGIAGDQRLDRDRGKVVGTHFGEPAAVAADRGPRGIANEHVSHRPLLLLSGYLGAAESSVKRLAFPTRREPKEIGLSRTPATGRAGGAAGRGRSVPPSAPRAAQRGF